MRFYRLYKGRQRQSRDETDSWVTNVYVKQYYTYVYRIRRLVINFTVFESVSLHSEIVLDTNDTNFKFEMRCMCSNLEFGAWNVRIKIEFVHVHALCVKNDFVHIKVLSKTNFPSSCLLQ